MIDKLLAEIFLLAFKINSETQYCVFVRYSGHVDNLSIEVRESKKRYNERVCDSETNIARSENPIKRLEKVITTLRGILESKEVDTSEMEEQVEYLYHYYF